MTDIAELFARDPNECSKQDIEEMVKEFRAKHHLFKTTGDMTAGRAKPKAPPKPKEPGVKLDLSSLGLSGLKL